MYDECIRCVSGLVQQPTSEVAPRGEAEEPETRRRPGGGGFHAVSQTAPQLGLQLHVLVHTAAHSDHGRHLQVRIKMTTISESRPPFRSVHLSDIHGVIRKVS